MFIRPTFTVELPAHADREDGSRPTFTFREGTCRERMAADVAYDFAACPTATDVINRIFPLIEAQLVSFDLKDGSPLQDVADDLHDSLSMSELVQLFVAMRNGMDVTFDEKKDCGSQSPSAPAESPRTTTRPEDAGN